MKKFKFTLTYKQPAIWIYTVIIEAYNINDAYAEAFRQFARHIWMWGDCPKKLEITYVEIKGEGLI